MIHHVSVGTNDVDRARAFYDPLMALLGYRNVRDYPHSLDYGVTDVVFSVETPVNGNGPLPATGSTYASKRRIGKQSGNFIAWL
ncbi:hypothetical protein [Sphingobium tyrosinilyticum]|uniref:Glyoxalase n=1 Tax=Sphingobium tyrosinilyticum TaxID=2715436 RepID=A0ABV9EVH8_9SPHN